MRLFVVSVGEANKWWQEIDQRGGRKASVLVLVGSSGITVILVTIVCKNDAYRVVNTSGLHICRSPPASTNCYQADSLTTRWCIFTAVEQELIVVFFPEPAAVLAHKPPQPGFQHQNLALLSIIFAAWRCCCYWQLTMTDEVANTVKNETLAQFRLLNVFHCGSVKCGTSKGGEYNLHTTMS